MDMELVSNLTTSRLSRDNASTLETEGSDRENRTHENRGRHKTHHAHKQDKTHHAERQHGIERSDNRHEHRPEKAEESNTLKYRHSERTTLLIETQEGDTVRLKIKSRETATLDLSQVEDGDTVISELQLQARSRTRIAIMINGDLNDDELAAIQGIIEQAGDLANDFFAGNLEDAFTTASAFEVDAAQLANVRIRMKSSEQLTYTGPASTGIRPALLQATDNPEPAINGGESSTIGTEATGQEAPVDATTENNEPEQNTQAVNDPAISDIDPEGQQTIMANALQSIGEFLNKLVNSFSNDNEHDANSTSHDMTLKLQIFQSMLLSIRETREPVADETTTDLLPETIEALAEQQIPLDAVA